MWNIGVGDIREHFCNIADLIRPVEVGILKLSWYLAHSPELYLWALVAGVVTSNAVHLQGRKPFYKSTFYTSMYLCECMFHCVFKFFVKFSYCSCKFCVQVVGGAHHCLATSVHPAPSLVHSHQHHC